MDKKSLLKKQRVKNYAVLIAVVSFVAIIFFVTLIKMKG